MAGDLGSNPLIDVASTSDNSVGMYCVPLGSTTVGPSGEIVSQPLKVYEQVDKTNQNLDVDLDGYITPDDAKLIIASLQRDPVFGPLANLGSSVASGEQGNGVGTTSRDLDVNDDGIVSPSDALAVMNRVHFYNALIPCTCAGCVAINTLES